jgi:hypothetical protein
VSFGVACAMMESRRSFHRSNKTGHRHARRLTAPGPLCLPARGGHGVAGRFAGMMRRF